MALGMKITNFHYSNAPPGKPYVYQEYPKWIHMAGYTSVVVQNAEEEAVLRARPPIGDKLTAPVLSEVIAEFSPKNIHDAPQPLDERSALMKVAEEHGIKIDRRWTTDRIKQTLEEQKP